MKKRLLVTIVTVGSRGDLHPACALAQGLQQKGYQPQIATHENFRSFVDNKGMKFARIAGNYQELLRSEAGYQLLEGKGSFNPIGDEIFYQQMLDAWEACQGSDAIIFPVLATWGYNIAEKLNIPGFLFSYMPISPTQEFPFLQFANVNQRFLRGYLNYSSYLLVEFLSWQQRRKLINQFRQEVLQLSPLPYFGGRFRQHPPKHLSPLPVLYQFSPAVLSRPHDWGDNLHITGNWFLDEAEDYQPPQALVDFVAQGSPPIYVGFGSMTVRDPQHLIEIILEALQLTGSRAILLTGWAGLEQANLPDNVLVVEYVPFEWLFPQMRVIVHHGGSGTTALALRAGIPSVIVPFFADQPAWGERLAYLGVSPDPIPFKSLSAKKLAAAIETAINDKSMRNKAEQLGARLRLENGVAQAVQIIQRYLEN